MKRTKIILQITVFLISPNSVLLVSQITVVFCVAKYGFSHFRFFTIAKLLFCLFCKIRFCSICKYSFVCFTNYSFLISQTTVFLILQHTVFLLCRNIVFSLHTVMFVRPYILATEPIKAHMKTLTYYTNIFG